MISIQSRHDAVSVYLDITQTQCVWTYDYTAIITTGRSTRTKTLAWGFSRAVSYAVDYRTNGDNEDSTNYVLAGNKLSHKKNRINTTQYIRDQIKGSST